MSFVNLSLELSLALTEVENCLSFGLSKSLNIWAEQGAPGYSLWKDGEDCRIVYGSKPAFFRALAVLSMRQGERSFAETQTPFAKDRGIMIDAARNGAPLLSALKRYAVNAAVMGFSYLELYTEDCFEIEGEPFFGYMRGRYLQSELREFDGFCAKLGLELVPCIQTLAHLRRVFEHVCYHDIVDNHDILLAGNEKTYAFIEKMIAACRSCFVSDRINLGMDEAFTIGLGNYLKQNGLKSHAEIFIPHLKRVAEICRKYGYETPSIWADMVFELPAKQRQDSVFDRIKPICWMYTFADGNVYEESLNELKSRSGSPSFCMAAWKWGSFAPQNRYTERVVTPALEACRKLEIDDVMIACWGDGGAEASLFSTIPSLILVSELCWGKRDNRRLEHFSKSLTGFGWEELRSLDNPNILYPGEVEKPLFPCKYLLYEDPFIGNEFFEVAADYPEYYRRYALLFEKLTRRRSNYSYLFRTLGALAKVLERKSTLGKILYDCYRSGDRKSLLAAAEGIPELIRLTKKFHSAFRSQWQAENKPIGFEVHDFRLGGLEARLKFIERTLRRYCSGELASIYELEQERLTIDYDRTYNNCSYIDNFLSIVTYNYHYAPGY